MIIQCMLESESTSNLWNSNNSWYLIMHLDFYYFLYKFYFKAWDPNQQPTVLKYNPIYFNFIDQILSFYNETIPDYFHKSCLFNQYLPTYSNFTWQFILKRNFSPKFLNRNKSSKLSYTLPPLLKLFDDLTTPIRQKIEKL